MPDYSPMMKQYFEIKECHKNEILFFRLGDFYEMFYEDALTASKELELTLTGRDCGQEERAPMCGVPFHSAESYIARLIEKGYKVAICEQVEDPRSVKGIVKRDVVRVITPGTVLESNMLDESRNNYICSLYCKDGKAGVVFADASTGEIYASRVESKKRSELVYELINEISKYTPSEILINPDGADLTELADFLRQRMSVSLEMQDFEEYQLDRVKENLKGQFSPYCLAELFSGTRDETALAVGALISYLKHTQISGIERFSEIDFSLPESVMGMDLNTRRNLELVSTLRNKEKRGSLLWVLDKTKTAMGKRLIRSWIEQPLVNPAHILMRQNAVEEIFSDILLADEIVQQLTGLFDLERITGRVVHGTANGRDLRSLCSAMAKLPAIKKQLASAKSGLLCEIYSSIDTLEDMKALIDRAIVEDPPFSIRDGGVIAAGYDSGLDELIEIRDNGKGVIASIEMRERQITEIPKLKIGYNRVFGYYIEVSNTYKSRVPDTYIRKQTIASGERYITQELKEIEGKILGANEKAISLEGEIFERVREEIAQSYDRIQKTAKSVAVLDVITSFAVVSRGNGYVRPSVNVGGRLYIKDGRHPVIERLSGDSPFVPNDVDMNMNESRISIITGPNMAGKSTFMRQAAVITIMAQIGCFVPAASAEIGIIDNVFTRVGASDDLSAGQSTFMVEMTEVADILRNATSRSLIIFDEIGRGTSTFDGMSIAKAVLEYVADKKRIGAKTLFATHYHELTEVENEIDGVKNYNIAVKKKGDDITFLRKIVRGAADDSFGIEVAKLAGVPDKVIKRAKQVLAELEGGEKTSRIENMPQRFSDEPIQLTMESAEGDVINKLRSIDVNMLTPMECMNLLFEISAMLK